MRRLIIYAPVNLKIDQITFNICKATHLSSGVKGCHLSPCKSGDREGSAACRVKRESGIQDCWTEELTTHARAKLYMKRRNGCSGVDSTLGKEQLMPYVPS